MNLLRGADLETNILNITKKVVSEVANTINAASKIGIKV